METRRPPEIPTQPISRAHRRGDASSGGAQRSPASPIAAEGTTNATRKRATSSTLINLGALLALFAVVFALQTLSNRTNRHDDAAGSSNAPAAQSTAPASTESQATPAAPAQSTKKTTARTVPNKESGTASPGLVNAEELERCRQLEAQAAVAPAAPSKKSSAIHDSARNQHSQLGEEDRLRSAELVNMLDGNYRRPSRGEVSTERYETPRYEHAAGQRTAPTPQTTYPSTAGGPAHPSYTADLDNETQRRQYLDANMGSAQTSSLTTDRAVATYTYEAAPPPRDLAMSAPQSAPEPRRKPAWDVNVGK